MNGIPLSLHEEGFLPHIACHVDLELRPGQIHVLTGENGIGKSTFLNQALNKYERQYRIALAGQPALEFFFDRTLATFCGILRSSERLDIELFNELWRLSGLQEKEGRYLSKLSGGEAQLLKLVSVGALKADFFFFDEPGQYLDPEKRKLADLIVNTLKTRNKAVLIVEHHPEWLSGRDVITDLFVEDGSLKGKTI